MRSNKGSIFLVILLSMALIIHLSRQNDIQKKEIERFNQQIEQLKQNITQLGTQLEQTKSEFTHKEKQFATKEEYFMQCELLEQYEAQYMQWKGLFSQLFEGG